MSSFLEKLKLIENLTTKLEIQQSDFIRIFQENVEKADIGVFADAFDVFSRSKHEYKGRVNYNEFEIKRRGRLFDTSLNLAKAKGTFVQKSNILIIESKIYGFSGRMIAFYGFMIIFYIIFIATIIFGNGESNGPWFPLPFILIHAAFMLGIPYLIMRRSVKRMKHDLEREFFYMTKDVSYGHINH